MTTKVLDLWEEKHRTGQDCAIIVPTRGEATELNRRCQQRRIQDAVKRGTNRLSFDGHTYIVGDRVRFLSGCFPLRAREGEIATVVGVDATEKTLELELDWAGPGITKWVTASLAEYGHIIRHGWVFTEQQEKGLNGQERIHWDSFFRDHFWELRRNSATEKGDSFKVSPQPEKVAGNGSHESAKNKKASREAVERMQKTRQSAAELRSRKKSITESTTPAETDKAHQRQRLQQQLLEGWQTEIQAEQSRIGAGLPEQHNLYPALSDWASSLEPSGNDREWEAVKAAVQTEDFPVKTALVASDACPTLAFSSIQTALVTLRSGNRLGGDSTNKTIGSGR